jgi:hypothetical protein
MDKVGMEDTQEGMEVPTLEDSTQVADNIQEVVAKDRKDCSD